MREKTRIILYASAGFLLLAVCFFTGRVTSPFFYFIYPLIMLMSIYIGFNTLMSIGFTFGTMFALMAFPGGSVTTDLFALFAKLLSLFLTSLASAIVARTFCRERERSENAIATFRGLSDDLKYKTMNLQAALDALSEVHVRLQNVDRGKTKFLANVTHELRTPLSSIRSYSEILMNYDDIDSETRLEFLKTINAESERMTIMINENLDLLKVESGKCELHTSPVNPRELLTGSMQVVAPMAGEKGIPILLDVPDNIPCVIGDPNQLTQVLVNLLNNAVKFTMAGEITLSVRVRDNYAEFSVADTGEGIFPEEKEAIFDEFYRISDNIPNRPKGSGLGLSISKKIVEYHHGSIGVESEPGKGSTFFFTIPLAGTAPETPVEEQFPVANEVRKQFGSILVVCENVAIRHSLRKKLEEMGYKTLGAGNPAKGLEIACAMIPALIISDVAEKWNELMQLAGWAKTAGIKVIMTTLHIGQKGDLRVVFNGYFSKPFDKFAIISTLEPIHKNKSRIVLVSTEQEESRNMQVLLGTKGYGINLFIDCGEAARACRNSPPDAIIVGSYTPAGVEEFVSALQAHTETAAIPLYLIVKSLYGKQVDTVTCNVANYKSCDEGLYALIMEVEKVYARKWGELKGDGGL